MPTTLPKTLPAFIWHFIRKRPLPFAVFFAAPMLVVLEAVVMPYALKIIVDAFSAYEDNRGQIMQAITPALWMVAIAWWSLIILIRLQEWWQVHVVPRFEADIRMSVLRYLTEHSYDYFANHLSGSIANKINDLPRTIDMLTLQFRWNVITTFSIVVVTLVILFQIDPQIALLALVWVTLDVSVSLSFVRYINRAAEVNAEDKSQLGGRIVDSISNIVATKLFAKRFAELAYLQEAQDIEMRSNSIMKWRVMIFRFAVDWPVTFMWIGMGYLLITNWQAERITTGDLVFVFNTIWTIMFRLWFLGDAMANMFKDYGTASQALSLVIQPHEITDREDAGQLNVPQGRIEFDNVSFHYNKGRSVFENKNVIIEPGQKVGLVGFSGSGKTTFVHLILRFFDVESGTIRIDGQDISSVTQDSLRSHIAMIPQDTALFHRSLMDNIRFGRQEAADEEVIAVSKLAHCHEFIEHMEQGYQTIVGERGVKLSGGQRQRIAIARAMLKNAPILMLDEATSALDSVTERLIQDSLQQLMQGKTTIVIAHRLSTLSAMDRILVFDKGHIIEDGNHEKLLAKKGHYAKMWFMQAGGFLPEAED